MGKTHKGFQGKTDKKGEQIHDMRVRFVKDTAFLYASIKSQYPKLSAAKIIRRSLITYASLYALYENTAFKTIKLQAIYDSLESSECFTPPQELPMANLLWAIDQEFNFNIRLANESFNAIEGLIASLNYKTAADCIRDALKIYYHLIICYKNETWELQLSEFISQSNLTIRFDTAMAEKQKNQIPTIKPSSAI